MTWYPFYQEIIIYYETLGARERAILVQFMRAVAAVFTNCYPCDAEVLEDGDDEPNVTQMLCRAAETHVAPGAVVHHRAWTAPLMGRFHPPKGCVCAHWTGYLEEHETGAIFTNVSEAEFGPYEEVVPKIIADLYPKCKPMFWGSDGGALEEYLEGKYDEDDEDDEIEAPVPADAPYTLSCMVIVVAGPA